jgi:acetyl esterase/lipase
MREHRRRLGAVLQRLAIGVGGVGCLAFLLGWLVPGGNGAEKNEPAPTRYEIRALENVAYYEGPDADKVRHKLDVYLPVGRTGFPVLMFIHGGSWTHGEKSYFGLNKALATLCARHGIATVIPNYRLSPAIQHPEHIKDVARAFAWTHKNIRTYGGRPDELFVAGHSAGGHLAALLATDETYLKAQGLSFSAIKGVIPMSGVFEIPAQVPSFDKMFGTDPRVRQAASPTWQVDHRPATMAASALPPFLILCGDHDFPLCGREPAEKFCKALQARKAQAEWREVRNRNHLTILVNASHEDDPAGKAIIDFIQARCVKQ